MRCDALRIFSLLFGSVTNSFVGIGCCEMSLSRHLHSLLPTARALNKRNARVHNSQQYSWLRNLLSQDLFLLVYEKEPKYCAELTFARLRAPLRTPSTVARKLMSSVFAALSCAGAATLTDTASVPTSKQRLIYRVHRNYSFKKHHFDSRLNE